ncbi:MAG: methylmalonyl Co-A mutase-associated GTPase MeaB, partial [Bacteroidota bacterium]|nr:methylmalonyl Co-A mutase-associated GTPase MeaB [Bacteroidota bacterium]
MVKRFYVDQYVDQILAGNRVVLSRAITLVESKLPADQELAQQVINRLLPYSGNSVRIGITGAPGVGKSTFIEALGNHIIQQNQKKLAVLA